jgi:acetyltransferase-like isoleucine patch superfamily enzyme
VKQQTEFQQMLTDAGRSSLRKYQELTTGSSDVLALAGYELTTLLFGYLPGAPGLLCRKIFYPRLFKKVGRGTVFGRSVTLRHPKKISIGENVVIDDNTVLDAKGPPGCGITIGNNVIVSRNTILSCKGGSIHIGDNTNIGTNCLIHSESVVRMGSNILVAAYCYLVAGGNHDFSRTDIPIIQQRSISKGGIVIEDNVWLGASVVVMDGVTIGRDCIVGANSLVLHSLPEFAIAFGSPARVHKQRK